MLSIGEAEASAGVLSPTTMHGDPVHYSTINADCRFGLACRYGRLALNALDA